MPQNKFLSLVAVDVCGKILCLQLNSRLMALRNWKTRRVHDSARSIKLYLQSRCEFLALHFFYGGDKTQTHSLHSCWQQKVAWELLRWSIVRVILSHFLRFLASHINADLMASKYIAKQIIKIKCGAKFLLSSQFNTERTRAPSAGVWLQI